MIGNPQEPDSQSGSEIDPTAEQLLARCEKERVPIWTDGDTAFPLPFQQCFCLGVHDGS